MRLLPPIFSLLSVLKRPYIEGGQYSCITGTDLNPAQIGNVAATLKSRFKALEVDYTLSIALSCRAALSSSVGLS